MQLITVMVQSLRTRLQQARCAERRIIQSKILALHAKQQKTSRTKIRIQRQVKASGVTWRAIRISHWSNGALWLNYISSLLPLWWQLSPHRRRPSPGTIFMQRALGIPSARPASGGGYVMGVWDARATIIYVRQTAPLIPR